MSKPNRNIKRPKRHAIPHHKPPTAASLQPRIDRPLFTPGQKSIIAIVIIAILAAIPFAMGKYFEFNTPGPFDSGAYVYSAQKIISGAEIGVDEKPSAKLGTLLVNMVGVKLCGFSETGPIFIQAILQAAALIMMFIAAKKLFGTFPAGISVIVASIYLSAPTISKFGNVKEQFMIAFMVLGASFFVLYQLSCSGKRDEGDSSGGDLAGGDLSGGKGLAEGGKWYFAVLAGAFASWAPLFKETGCSVIGAIGLFMVAQAVLKRRTVRQTGVDILLLLAGAAIATGPLFLWIIAWDVQLGLPFAFVWQTLGKFIPSGGEAAQPAADYIKESREHAPFKEQFWRVMRYYTHLILPVALALGAIIAKLVRLVRSRLAAKKAESRACDPLVLLLGVWWVLDMAFIWISPRSYEQYYLPMTASGAMLGGYLVAVYCDRAKTAETRPKWIAIGVLGLLTMIIMSWQVFFGTTKSPHSGTTYINRNTGEIERRRGYLQKFRQVAIHRLPDGRGKGAWELVGEHIRANSEETDQIYVWGWYPGIYVAAQRLSPAPKAFEGNMHTLSPEELSIRIGEILASFEKTPPKFIVDSLKQHFPWDRPPLQLWPRTNNGFLSTDKRAIETFEANYAKLLGEKIEPAEAERFKVMGAFREFVMTRYKIVQGAFSNNHVLFERK